MKLKKPIDLPRGAIVLEPRDQYDQAIIGKTLDGRVIYSQTKIIQAIQEMNECGREDALDHYYFNIDGSIENFGARSPKIRKDFK